MFSFTSTIILPFFYLSTPLSSNLMFYREMISAGGEGRHPSCTERKLWLLGRILSEVLGWVREQGRQALGSREGWGTASPKQHLICLSWLEASDKVVAHLRFLQMLCEGTELARFARPYLRFAFWRLSGNFPVQRSELAKAVVAGTRQRNFRLD